MGVALGSYRCVSHFRTPIGTLVNGSPSLRRVWDVNCIRSLAGPSSFQVHHAYDPECLDVYLPADIIYIPIYLVTHFHICYTCITHTHTDRYRWICR